MKFCNIAKVEIIWERDKEFKLVYQIIYKLCVFVIVYLSTHRQTHVNNRMLIYVRSNTRRRTSVSYDSAYTYLRHWHQFTWTEVDIATSRETIEIIRPDLCEASMGRLSILCVYEGIWYSLIHTHEVCLMLL